MYDIPSMKTGENVRGRRGITERTEATIAMSRDKHYCDSLLTGKGENSDARKRIDQLLLD